MWHYVRQVSFATAFLFRPAPLPGSRQKLPILDRTVLASADGLARGAYILSMEEELLLKKTAEEGTNPTRKCDVILISTGSEVHIILEAQQQLLKSGINSRVVSMPSWELFKAQPKEYRDKILPPACKSRIALEAASPVGWAEWVGDEGVVIGISKFGTSAPYEEIYEHYGITAEHVVAEAKKLMIK